MPDNMRIVKLKYVKECWTVDEQSDMISLMSSTEPESITKFIEKYPSSRKRFIDMGKIKNNKNNDLILDIAKIEEEV